jgi:hypothetical protein
VRQNEQVALTQFTERFVASGGEREQAASAFKAYRNEQAVDVARQADQRARQGMYQSRMRAV